MDNAPPVTELGDLLDALTIPFVGTRKALALVTFEPPNTYRVHEYFDDGHGHSNSTSVQTRAVSIEIFREACERGFVVDISRNHGFAGRNFMLVRGPRFTETLRKVSAIVTEWKRKEKAPVTQ